MLRQVGVNAYAEFFYPLEGRPFFAKAFMHIEAPPHGFPPLLYVDGDEKKPVYFCEPYETEGGYPCLCLDTTSEAYRARKELLESFGDVCGEITQTYGYTPWGHKSFEGNFFKVMFRAGLTFKLNAGDGKPSITLGVKDTSKKPLTLIEACDTLLMCHYLADNKAITNDNLEVRFDDVITIRLDKDDWTHTSNLRQDPNNPYSACLRALKSKHQI